MASTSDLLGGLDGGRVLDVGTGRGSFTRTLIDELRSYTEIIGLDVSDADATAFADSFGAMPSVVAIAGSLHHMANPEQVLMEMRRVLSSGGAFIVSEQFRDRLTRPETTHRLFHEWSEQVMAVAFRRTYRRAEIIDLVNGIDFEGVQQIVVRDDSDPMSSRKIARWDGLIADLLYRVRGRADLVARGRTIRAHLREDGILVGLALFTLGTKPKPVTPADPPRHPLA